MKRPSKKDIKAALEKLKDVTPNEAKPPETGPAKPAPTKNNRRIRKQGV